MLPTRPYFLLAVGSLVTACSSTPESEPPPASDGAVTADTASDSSIDAAEETTTADSGSIDTAKTEDVGDVATDTTSGDPTCGPGPYLNIPLSVNHYTGKLVAKVTNLACPGVTWTVPTNTTPSPLARLTQKERQILRAEAPGLFPGYSPSFLANGGVSFGVTLKSAADRIVTNSGWDPKTQAMIQVFFSKNGTTAACKNEAGLTIGPVAGHPEAQIKYSDAFGKFTAPSAEPFQDVVVLLTPKSVGEIVKLTASKPGCTVTSSTVIFPGDIAIEVGATSGAELYIADP
jgi:hypothetical protein